MQDLLYLQPVPATEKSIRLNSSLENKYRCSPRQRRQKFDRERVV